MILLAVGRILFSAEESSSVASLSTAIAQRLGTRSAHLVMYNDVLENYRMIPPEEFPFPWSPSFAKLGGIGGAMIGDLVKVFTSNQTLLCTKTLWYQLQFFAKMWEDFAYMNIEELQKEYANYCIPGNDLHEKMSRYRAFISDLNRAYRFNIWRNPGEYTANDLEIMKLMVQQHKITNPSYVYALQLMYWVYLYVIDEQFYRCYDVNEWYLLFVPRSEIHTFPKLDAGSNVILSSIISGLNLSLTPSSQYREYLNPVEEHSIMVNHPSVGALGFYTVDAISKVMLDKHKISTESFKLDLIKLNLPISELLPTFNVLIIGHGEPNKYLAGIKPTDMVNVLMKFDEMALMQSASIGSCFMGGNSLFNLSKIMDQEIDLMQRNKMIQGIRFPIIFASSFCASISLRHQSLSTPFAFYSFFKNKLYQRFFDALTQQDSTTKIAPPYYQKAMNIIFDILDHQGLVRPSRLNQYLSIKFPNLPVIQAYDYDKRVQSITPIVASYKDKITISKNTRVVLLKTDLIAAPVEISDTIKIKKDHSIDSLSWLTFLPVHYSNQNYRFHEIRIPEIEGLHHGDLVQNVVHILQDLFFAVSYYSLGSKSKIIQEIIYLVIDRMILGDVQLSNVTLSLSDLSGSFDLEFPFYNTPISYTFKCIDKKWDITIDDVDDQGAEIRVWVSDHLRSSKAFEKRKISELLQAVLKETEEQIPDIVKSSRLQYNKMSPKAKEKNIFRKKNHVELNPHVRN